MKTRIQDVMTATEAGRLRDRAALDMMTRTGRPFAECYAAILEKSSTPASRGFQRETGCAELEPGV